MVWISDDIVDHTPDFCIALVYGRDVFRSWSNEYPNDSLCSLVLAFYASLIGPLTVMTLSVSYSVSSSEFDSANHELRVASLLLIVEAVLGILRKFCCSNVAIRRDIS